MKIIVNSRFLIKNKLEGIGWFTYETAKRITANHPEHQFIFLFDRPFSDEFIFSNNITPVIINPPARHPFLWYIWFEYSVKNLLNKEKPDLFLSMDGFLSLKTKVKSLPVIHDLNFHFYPKDLPFFVRNYYNHFFPQFARKAKRIATVSEHTKKNISDCYDISSQIIDVVYNGANEAYTPISEEEKTECKAKYSFGKDYFVFVGMLHPRKNIIRLLKAFNEFKNAYSSDIKLIIIGEKIFFYPELDNYFSNMFHKEDVLFIGRKSANEINIILGSGLALVFVPYFEGFGIPIIEAMNCDVPVITSDVTSMPEVAGDAALLVDPFSVESIKNAMLKIAKDYNLRIDLIMKGQEQRQKFSWDSTALKLWNSVEKCFD
jgi:glycosyltransferase involved in cell wall biosynthesis